MVANAQMLQCIQPDKTQCMHTQYTWLSAHDRVHMTEGTYILRRFCLPWARWPVDTLKWLHLFCSFRDAKNYVHYNSLTKMFNWRWTCIFFELGCKISTLWWPLWTVLVRDHLGNPDKDLHRLGDPSASNPAAFFAELSFSYKKRFETGLRSRCLPC